MKTITRHYYKTNNNILLSYFQNNIREYAIVSIIFIIGILFGVIFINNINNSQSNEISTYVTTSINNLKENPNISKIDILKESITKDFLVAFLLWLLGSTVIGLLLVYAIVCFKGFCLGYTISAVIYSLSTGKALIFLLSTIFLKNIISIPAIIALAVSGMKLYKSIMQDRRKENIKLEIVRHTLFSILIF